MRLKKLSLAYGSTIFKALSDESRIRMLHLLHLHGALCISDLEMILDFTQTKTSRHLTYLRNAGILNIKRSRQWTFYQIKEEIRDIIGYLLAYMEHDKILAGDSEALQNMDSNRELARFKVEKKEWTS